MVGEPVAAARTWCTAAQQQLAQRVVRRGDPTRRVAGRAPARRTREGLLALLLLQDSRRTTRETPEGELVLLEDQDRSAWGVERIAEGLQHLQWAVVHGRPGQYQLEAAIAAEHARTATWEATDWPTIAALYGALTRLVASPVVELNRAVAVGYAEGPHAGLRVLAALADDPRLARSHRLSAVHADLLRRAGPDGKPPRPTAPRSRRCARSPSGDCWSAASARSTLTHDVAAHPCRGPPDAPADIVACSPIPTYTSGGGDRAGKGGHGTLLGE
jgi:hypothetical protein